MRSSRPDPSLPADSGAAEWCLLQNQFDSYEKHSLVLKLASIIVVLSGWLLHADTIFMAALLLVIWMQDAIWKTFQSRIEQRLLRIEGSMIDRPPEAAGFMPYQFNSEYRTGRGDHGSLLAEYALQALRPTVAFPHAVLFILYGLYLIVSVD